MVSAAVSNGRKCFRGPGLQRGRHKRTLPQTRGGWRALGVAVPTALEAVPLARGLRVAAPFLGAQRGLALLRAHGGSQQAPASSRHSMPGRHAASSGSLGLTSLGITACPHARSQTARLHQRSQTVPSASSRAAAGPARPPSAQRLECCAAAQHSTPAGQSAILPSTMSLISATRHSVCTLRWLIVQVVHKHLVFITLWWLTVCFLLVWQTCDGPRSLGVQGSYLDWQTV